MMDSLAAEFVALGFLSQIIRNIVCLSLNFASYKCPTTLGAQEISYIA